MNIHMSSKNTKTKVAPKVEAKKQTAGTPEKVVAVPTANTIVEKKMEDKVVAVEKKSAAKKGGAKTETPKVEAAPTPAPAPVAEKKVAAKKGGAKAETPKVEAAPAKTEAPTEKKATKKGGAKTEAPKAEAAPAKVEAKTEKKAEKKADTKKGGAKKEAKKEEAKKEEVKAAAQDDDEEGEVAGSKLRYFKLIYNEEVQGRYCGKKPKQAANKAFSSIIKDLKKTGQQNGGVNVDINFSIRECTRNSKHKEYKYIGKRQVLENPVQVKIANADGSVKQIEYKFHNKLQKAPKA